MCLNAIDNSKCIWINENQSSFSTTSSHQSQFGGNVKNSDVGMLLFFSLFVCCAPQFIEIESIKEFDCSIECRTYQTNVSDIPNACDLIFCFLCDFVFVSFLSILFLFSLSIHSWFLFVFVIKWPIHCIFRLRLLSWILLLVPFSSICTLCFLINLRS